MAGDINSLNLLVSDVIYVISPAEVFRYCDPKVLGSGYTFKFSVV